MRSLDSITSPGGGSCVARGSGSFGSGVVARSWVLGALSFALLVWFAVLSPSGLAHADETPSDSVAPSSISTLDVQASQIPTSLPPSLPPLSMQPPTGTVVQVDPSELGTPSPFVSVDPSPDPVDRSDPPLEPFADPADAATELPTGWDNEQVAEFRLTVIVGFGLLAMLSAAQLVSGFAR